ncbi:MAG: zf-TFIIB domain-containing protein [Thermodesulfobacteriota bacterium]
MTVEKTVSKEEEFFLKINQEKISKLRGELDQKRSEAEKNKRKQIHWMKCPKCGSDLHEVNHQNVMIDTCTECKGIWLDGGELSLLIEGQAKFSKGLLTKLFGSK